MRAPLMIGSFAILAIACSSGDAASTLADAGLATEAGPHSDAAAAPGTLGGSCTGGICDDGLECVLDHAANVVTCESAFTCTGSAPGSYANTGGVSVSTWAEAQQACSVGTAGPGSYLSTTPCGGFVFFGQSTADNGSLAVFDAATGALVAILIVGEYGSCAAGTASVPVSCPSGNPTSCADPPDEGGLDAGDASD
jgi:hypothetical protein